MQRGYEDRLGPLASFDLDSLIDWVVTMGDGSPPALLPPVEAECDNHAPEFCWDWSVKMKNRMVRIVRIRCLRALI